MTPRSRFRWLQRGLLALGLLLFGLWSRTTVESRSFQSAESRKLDAAFQPAAAASKLPVQRTALGKGVLGRIEIPRLRIAAMVAEGTDAKTLRRAVGHITSTALPGKPGNCALAGHRDTFFRGLGGVRAKDVIRVVTPGGVYTYRVEWSVVVQPHRVDVLNPTDDRSLTLITCYPFAYVGHAPKRFVVRAVQVDEAAGSAAIEDRGGLAAEGR